MTELMERQARNMARLIEDLLDISRIGLGKLRLSCDALDLAATVHAAVEVTRPLIASRQHTLDVSLPPGPIPLHGDATRLEQVVVNLLTNAARYTPPGGRIWLTVERGANQVVLRVRDTGIGVAPELLPYLFDLYMQATNGSRGGLGIGLNLVRSLVRMHGGEVMASSDGPGHGTEFVLHLPTILPGGTDARGSVVREGDGPAAQFRAVPGTRPAGVAAEFCPPKAGIPAAAIPAGGPARHSAADTPRNL